MRPPAQTVCVTSRAVILTDTETGAEWTCKNSRKIWNAFRSMTDAERSERAAKLLKQLHESAVATGRCHLSLSITIDAAIWSLTQMPSLESMGATR